jgi:hypothetical protein
LNDRSTPSKKANFGAAHRAFILYVPQSARPQIADLLDSNPLFLNLTEWIDWSRTLILGHRPKKSTAEVNLGQIVRRRLQDRPKAIGLSQLDPGPFIRDGGTTFGNEASFASEPRVAFWPCGSSRRLG